MVVVAVEGVVVVVAVVIVFVVVAVAAVVVVVVIVMVVSILVVVVMMVVMLVLVPPRVGVLIVVVVVVGLDGVLRFRVIAEVVVEIAHGSQLLQSFQVHFTSHGFSLFRHQRGHAGCVVDEPSAACKHVTKINTEKKFAGNMLFPVDTLPFCC